MALRDRRNRNEKTPERRPAEGVRIIRADEAQAALEAGEVAGRRGEDELRFGDRPPVPAGPRPPHRFPLPESVDPAEAVPLPKLAARMRPDEGHQSSQDSGESITDEGVTDATSTWEDQPAAPSSSWSPSSEKWEPADPTSELGVVGRAAAPAAEQAELDLGETAAPAEPEPRRPVLPEYRSTVDPDDVAAAAENAPAPLFGATTAPNPVFHAHRAAEVAGQPEASSEEPVAEASAPAEPTPAPAPPAAPQGGSLVEPPPPPPMRSTTAGGGAHFASSLSRREPTVSEPPTTLAEPPAAAPEPTAAGAEWAPPEPAAPAEPSHLAPPEEGITVTGGTDLPHWTDPPTGDVPRILAGDDDPGDDDLEAWNALGSRGMRWRDESDDWSDVDEIGALAGEDEPVGALDQTRTDHSDVFEFDEAFERAEAERTGAVYADPAEEAGYEPEPVEARQAVPRRSRPARATRASGTTYRPGARAASHGGGRGDDDLTSRVVVGVGLVVLLVVFYFIGSAALVFLTAALAVAAAAEAYGMLQRSGFRPATLLGLVATVCVVFGAYWKGPTAIPLAVALVFAGSMLWYLLGIVEARPLANVAVTTMGFVWIGVMASFGAVMLEFHHGRGLFFGAVLVGVAADIGGFIVGRWIGSRPIAAHVSPSKTIEGFIGGVVAAVIVGAIVGKFISPWGGMKHGLLLGLVIGLIAPAGDLFESMIKRDLGVKDSGSLLRGHGGLLDRFDSVLLVLPAAYYLASLFHVIKIR